MFVISYSLTRDRSISISETREIAGRMDSFNSPALKIVISPSIASCNTFSFVLVLRAMTASLICACFNHPKKPFAHAKTRRREENQPHFLLCELGIKLPRSEEHTSELQSL